MNERRIINCQNYDLSGKKVKGKRKMNLVYIQKSYEFFLCIFHEFNVKNVFRPV